VYIGGVAAEPAQTLTGHAEHVQGFGILAQYSATMHFNGQSMITLDGDRATGWTYCLAHHLQDAGDGRTLLVHAIRYEDTFVKRDGDWRFAERRLLIDWSDSRPSRP
jgi:hypothetical protein